MFRILSPQKALNTILARQPLDDYSIPPAVQANLDDRFIILPLPAKKYVSADGNALAAKQSARAAWRAATRSPSST